MTFLITQSDRLGVKDTAGNKPEMVPALCGASGLWGKRDNKQESNSIGATPIMISP